MGMEDTILSDAEKQKLDVFEETKPESANKSAVYALFDANSGEALWVGETGNVFQRLTSHHTSGEKSNLKGEIMNDPDADIDLDEDSLWSQTKVIWMEVNERRSTLEKMLTNRLEPRYGSE